MMMNRKDVKAYGILGVLVYGDLVEGKPSSRKGWLSLSGPEGELGFVEAAALTPSLDRKSVV